MTQLALTIALETPSDAASIKSLHERAFGPGRFARTASRLREIAEADARLSFTARVGTLLVGSIRLTPLMIGTGPGASLKALMLGPLAVEPAFEGRGIGRALMQTSLDAAAGLDYALVILIGDEPYYGKLGFRRVPVDAITLPAPVDPMRLLYRDLIEGSFAQLLTPARVMGGSPAE